jgi:catechol 2,3-dioxygenase-like lactoylglutathione lyase family enzyme
MTLKLNHPHLKTRDPEKTVRFYVDNLGATVVSENPNGYRLDLHGLGRPAGVLLRGAGRRAARVHRDEEVMRDECRETNRGKMP